MRGGRRRQGASERSNKRAGGERHTREGLLCQGQPLRGASILLIHPQRRPLLKVPVSHEE